MSQSRGGGARTCLAMSATLMFALLLTLGGASASAQEYPPGPPENIETDRSEVPPGDSYVVTVNGLKPFSFATLTFEWPPHGAETTLTDEVDADGVAQFVVVVPDGTPDGAATHLVEGTDKSGGPVSYTIVVEVDASAGAAAEGATANTAESGAPISNLTVLSAGLLLLGAAMLTLFRRPNTISGA